MNDLRSEAAHPIGGGLCCVAGAEAVEQHLVAQRGELDAMAFWAAVVLPVDTRNLLALLHEDRQRARTHV